MLNGKNKQINRTKKKECQQKTLPREETFFFFYLITCFSATNKTKRGEAAMNDFSRWIFRGYFKSYIALNTKFEMKAERLPSSCKHLPEEIRPSTRPRWRSDPVGQGQVCIRKRMRKMGVKNNTIAIVLSIHNYITTFNRLRRARQNVMKNCG